MKKKIISLLLVLACLACIVAVFASCDSTPKYTITFDPDGGVMKGRTTITAKEGSKIKAPEISKEGYYLKGWYASKKSSSKWDFDEDTVKEDMTLTAWWGVGSNDDDSSTSTCEHDYQLDQNRLDDCTEATCTRDGITYFRCTLCRRTKTELVKAYGHNETEVIVPPTCAERGYTEKACSNENCTSEPLRYDYINATGKHQYDTNGDGRDDYKYTIIPTDYTPGISVATCQVCKGTKSAAISALVTGTAILDSLKIDNYLYKGQTPYVNIAGYAGVNVSSYYTVCVGSNINDDALGTYWSADTLADGSDFSSDYFELNFGDFFQIGALNLVVPYYSNWGLGDDCYVSYTIEAFVKDESLAEGGKWVSIGEMSDKNAVSSGQNGSIMLELDSPIMASKIKATVSYSTRFAPAMVYEIQVFANTDNVRVAGSLLSSAEASVSGKYNDYAGGADALVDGDINSSWTSGWRYASEAYATLTFPGEKFLSAVQFATPAHAGRTLKLTIFQNGEWKEIGTYTVPSNKQNTDTVQFIEVSDDNGAGGIACMFTIPLLQKASQIRIDFLSEPQYWNSKLYCFEPYTIFEIANNVNDYTGCKHPSARPVTNGVVAPTCTTAGYTTYKCQACDFTFRTDATSALGHKFGAYEITTAAQGTAKGIKSASCANNCGVTRQVTYTESYVEATITPYYKNAPSAWAQTYDDGNYIEACKWSIKQFEKYHYKATMNMSITFSDGYVSEWQEMFATGAFDLGSHSYKHAGIYAGKISENSMLNDVDKAHFWFMAKYRGQQILTFATPNGTTSASTADYVTNLMASGRNGGPSYINLISDLTTKKAWGSINCYASKSDQTEGNYVLVANGSTGGTYKVTIEIKNEKNDKGEDVIKDGVVQTYKSYTVEWTTKGSYKAANYDSFVENDSGEYVLVHNIAANGTFTERNAADEYKFVKKTELKSNFVYDTTAGTLVDQSTVENGAKGSYMYDPETMIFTWFEGGSYDFDPVTKAYTFKADGTGKYQLLHTSKGSYEKVIDELLSKNAFTVECIHSLEKETYYRGGLIHSSYVSTISKYEYLKKQGLWVCSYTNLTQYLKESLNAHVDTKEITDSSITLTLTDDLTDYMFNHALTIKVDIPDDWTNVTVTQGGKAIQLVTKEEYKDNMTVANCTIMDGFLYVDAVPDCGDIVITKAQ